MKSTFDMQITILYPLFSQKQNKVNENQGTNDLYTPNANATLGAISKKQVTITNFTITNSNGSKNYCNHHDHVGTTERNENRK